ncbi:hypothetical protein [Bradyrhizobium sp. URHD0069]|uniref:hypothetical protein n=1 Tax=Bradyrhizobium sp. URHD0069 TaxID=1380355 RepID=UPI0012DEF3DD|nr:hypothetical protein [Bradyrhizobium sp. URHD0069]
MAMKSDDIASAIYQNAVDSLRIGMEFFLKEESYSSRKHAILTVFHAIELFLKEQLARSNPILIYKNIDAKITDEAMTVGVREALARLENLGLGIPDEEKRTIENIQRVRNRIEHHRYDHNEKEDNAIIASSLKFILYFVEFVLERKLDGDIDGKILRDICRRVFEYSESYGLAQHRFHEWLRSEWPDGDEEKEDNPEEFEGTHRCPECRQDWLVIGWHDKPVCFGCNMTINVDMCDDCGDVFIIGESCDCGKHKKKDDGQFQAVLDQWRGESIRLQEERATQRAPSAPASDDTP